MIGDVWSDWPRFDQWAKLPRRPCQSGRAGFISAYAEALSKSPKAIPAHVRFTVDSPGCPCLL